MKKGKALRNISQTGLFFFLLINSCSIFFQPLLVIFTMAAVHLVKITHSPYCFTVLKFNSKVQSARELALSTKNADSSVWK